MQFDDSKFELIHFKSHKVTFNQTIMLFNDTVVKSKICIQWLEVWLNRKLNFKMHMQMKIVAVTRTLHSLFKLMNSEWKLNAKSERQLYLACIIIISDYNVEIWWNNQKSHAIKFRKLQNAALRKILKAFQTSLIKVMQIKTEISSVKVQLDQKCKNYAIKIVELLKKHLIRKWTFISFDLIWFDLIWIHTFLWHWFKLNSWETLCYLYRVNKTLWERKSLVVYMMTSRRWNNDHETMYQVCIYSFYSACDAQVNF